MKRLLIAAAAAALALPAAATAHVTIQPRELPAGGFTRVDVRVPNERDDKGTRKVDVQLPPGFAFVSHEPQPGWRVKLERRKLDRPIEIEEGFEIAEEVARVTFTATSEEAVIQPGQFRDFGLSVRMPDGKPGAALTFKALQTYEGGEVVRWIGPEGSDEPAPTVTLTEGGGHGAPAAAEEKDAAAGHSAGSGSGDDGNTLAVVALIVGGLGLLTGLAGLAAVRRARAATT